MLQRVKHLQVPTCVLGGMKIARLTRGDTARLMLDIVSGRVIVPSSPVFMTSSNGQVLSMYARSARVRALYDQADIISADGKPMVMASRFTSRPVPGRCSTTDLYHDVSKMAPPGTKCFLFGASGQEVQQAVAVTRKFYPHLDIVGFSHGFLQAHEEEALLDRLEVLKPDILWIGLGVPRQQEFVVKHRKRLACVKIIKTCGGLFNFISGTAPRAPMWMQRAGLEWVFRLMQEPHRLFWRYLITNPHSAYLLLARTR